MDLNKLELNDPKVQRALLIILTGIVGAGLIVWYQLMPLQEEYTKLERELTQKEQRLTEIRNVQTQLRELQASVARLQHECDSLETKFLSGTDITVLMDNLARLALKRGVMASNFRPLPAQAITREYYSEQKYEIVLVGAYHTIGKFLEDLANLDLIIKVSNIDMKTNPGLNAILNSLRVEQFEGLEQEPESVLVTFLLTTFAYKQE